MVEIKMQDCHPLGCTRVLGAALKVHKKKYGKEHVCNKHCDAYFAKLHRDKHEWYNNRNK
jgi:hypothetical protein